MTQSNVGSWSIFFAQAANFTKHETVTHQPRGARRLRHNDCCGQHKYIRNRRRYGIEGSFRSAHFRTVKAISRRKWGKNSARLVGMLQPNTAQHTPCSPDEHTNTSTFIICCKCLCVCVGRGVVFDFVSDFFGCGCFGLRLLLFISTTINLARCVYACVCSGRTERRVLCVTHKDDRIKSKSGVHRGAAPKPKVRSK